MLFVWHDSICCGYSIPADFHWVKKANHLFRSNERVGGGSPTHQWTFRPLVSSKGGGDKESWKGPPIWTLVFWNILNTTRKVYFLNKWTSLFSFSQGTRYSTLYHLQSAVCSQYNTEMKVAILWRPTKLANVCLIPKLIISQKWLLLRI